MTGYVTIDSIVRGVLADEGYNTLHPYLRYLHYALEGEEDWRQDYGLEIKTKKLPVNENKTVDFPKDMIGWNKLGVLIGDRIVAFTKDVTLLNTPESLSQPRQPFFQVYDTVEAEYYEFINTYDSGRIIAPSYGMNMPGYFVEDHSRRRFVLSDEVKAKEVFLEYIPEGCDPSGKTYVMRVAAKLMNRYIKWKYAENQYGPESSRARMWRQEWLNEQDEVNSRLMTLDYNTILDLSRKYFDTRLNA